MILHLMLVTKETVEKLLGEVKDELLVMQDTGVVSDDLFNEYSSALTDWETRDLI